MKETQVAPEPADLLDVTSIVGAPEQVISVKVPGAHGTRVLKAGRLLGSGRLPKGSSSRRALKQAEKSGLASALSIDGAQSLQKMAEARGAVGDDRGGSGIIEAPAVSTLHDKVGQGDAMHVS